MCEQSHQSDPRVLGRRTSEEDHRQLAAILEPGMSVLDVGCGSGAITAGIARRVGPNGRVTGIDRDESLLNIARQEHRDIANLNFEHAGILSLECQNQFDVVTAARVLQWISAPAVALHRMALAVKRGGLIVVLDYDHAHHHWEPARPVAFRLFYQVFLDYRSAHKWSNLMGDELAALFRGEGLVDIRVTIEDEAVARGDTSFLPAAAIWNSVMESLGPTMAAAGFLSGDQQHEAARDYFAYLEHGLQKQCLSLRTATGRRS